MTWKPDAVHLVCRDLQHAWEPHTARKIKSGFVRVLVCSRCSSTKTQRLDRHGFIMQTSMTYVQGYLRPGQGRLTRADRAELRVRDL